MYRLVSCLLTPLGTRIPSPASVEQVGNYILLMRSCQRARKGESRKWLLRLKKKQKKNIKFNEFKISLEQEM